VYKFYAAGNTAEAASASTMDFDEYCSLVRDIAVTTTPPKLTKKEVMLDFDLIFHEERKAEPGTDAANSMKDKPDPKAKPPVQKTLNRQGGKEMKGPATTRARRPSLMGR
jgi:hypothetical protein